MGCGASAKSKYAEPPGKEAQQTVPTTEEDGQARNPESTAAVKAKAQVPEAKVQVPDDSSVKKSVENAKKSVETLASTKTAVSTPGAEPRLSPRGTGSAKMVAFRQAPQKQSSMTSSMNSSQIIVAEEASDTEDDWVDEIPESHRASENQLRKRRGALSSDAHGEYNKPTDFVPERIPKTQEQAALIRDALFRSPWMASMTSRDEDLEIAIAAFKHVSLPKGAEVIRQGDDGDELYLLESGVVDFYIRREGDEHPGIKVKQMSEPGNEFGELALLHNAPRKATVIAVEDCALWSLSRNVFNAVMTANEAKRYERHLGFLRNVKLLEKLDIIEIGKVAEHLRQHILNKGDYVVKEGEMADRFYMVEEGEAMAITHGMEVRSYKQDGYFGELSLINDRPTPADIVAKSDKLILVSLDRASFQRLLGHGALFKETPKKEDSGGRDSQESGFRSTADSFKKSRKKGSVTFSDSVEQEIRPKFQRKGTGFVQKNKIKDLLAQMQDCDVEDEEEDEPDSPENEKKLRFKGGSTESLREEPPKRNQKIRTTGFIHVDQLRKILDEVGEDAEDDEEEMADEQVKGTKVSFDAPPGEGRPKNMVKRGTGFIHTDQLKKILAEAEIDDEEEDEDDEASTSKPARKVQFDADPSQGRPKLHKKGTGFIFREQLENLLGTEDEEEGEGEEEAEKAEESDIPKKMSLASHVSDNDLDAHDADMISPVGQSRPGRRMSDAVIYVSAATLRQSLGAAYDIPEVKASHSEESFTAD